jgi:anaerobic magnesium-protoporphyrin IX monomethyl ester cyclase
MEVRVLLVEPPKETWFVMGEYLPPPLGILQLAAYLDREAPEVEIQVVDCQAQGFDWYDLERRMESFKPDIVAPSSLATCNAYTSARTVELAKRTNPDVLTAVGGQHFTALARESLESYPEVDVVVRGEGEQSFLEIVRARTGGKSLSGIRGISFRHDGEIIHGPPRPPIDDLDALPMPGYKFVEDIVSRYHFRMMAGDDAGYALIEASRGCPHRCTFCSQWKHWQATYRSKSPKRIADEMEYCYNNYGIRFLWLTDDNFGMGKRTEELCAEIVRRGLSEEIMWFMQVRCDDIVGHPGLIPKLRRASNHWMLVGLESGNPQTLDSFNKGIRPDQAKRAMDLLKDNDIFAQATLIIGERKDTRETISGLRDFVEDVDPDLAIFMILTPFPGTELYEEAKSKGWIEDTNWANYDMVHAIMPTETLSRGEVQEELYNCYRSFYGSMSRRFKGLFSRNAFKRRTYRHLASQGLLKELRGLFA